MIMLGQTDDGRLVLGNNNEFPAYIKHVEYFRDQRLFNLVFDTDDEESTLMPAEITPEIAAIVHSSPSLIIITKIEKGQKPCGYAVPLVQIGV